MVLMEIKKNQSHNQSPNPKKSLNFSAAPPASLLVAKLVGEIHSLNRPNDDARQRYRGHLPQTSKPAVKALN